MSAPCRERRETIAAQVARVSAPVWGIVLDATSLQADSVALDD